MVTDLSGTPILEGTTAEYTVTLRDGVGAPLAKAGLSSLSLTVASAYSGLAVAGYDAVDALPYMADTTGLVTVPLSSAATAKTTTLALELLVVMLEWQYPDVVGRHFAVLGLVAR